MKIRLRIRHLPFAAGTLLFIASQAEAPPAWWTERGVLTPSAAPDNYAPANLGQAKHMAAQALAEMNDKLAAVGGAGFLLTDLFPAPPPSPGLPDYNSATWQAYAAANYAPLNIGQLKNLSYRFYDRLTTVGYTLPATTNPQAYPWTASTADDDNYAPANLGQLKNVFSFDLSVDPSNNGLPPAWELQNFGSFRVDPNGDADDDGLTNLQEFQLGTDPNDPNSGQPPTLTVVSGTPQTGPKGGYVPRPLVVQVSNPNGLPRVNAPVRFNVSSGGGLIRTSGSQSLVSTLTLSTDDSGQARVFFQLPNVGGQTCHVTAVAIGGSQATSADFVETSDDGSGAYGSPFDPTDVRAILNADGSGVVTWTNNTDSTDQEPIIIQYTDATGHRVTLATAPAGTTSYEIPAQHP